MPKKLSGRVIANTIKERLKKEVAAMTRKPGLAAVLVGDNKASRLYVELKEKACNDVGIRFEKCVLPEHTTTQELLALIAALNSSETVDGILIQLPLPQHLDTSAVIAAMLPTKDADGFHPVNLKALQDGKRPAAPPVLLNAVGNLLRSSGSSLKGKKAIVVGNSDVFCATMKGLEKEFGLDVRGLSAKQLASDRNRKQAAGILQKADVLIVAAGKPKLIDADMVKDGVIIVDIGTTHTDTGVTGDVSSGAYAKSSLYTPVPGGVGPVTVACLLENVVALAQQHIAK